MYRFISPGSPSMSLFLGNPQCGRKARLQNHSAVHWDMRRVCAGYAGYAPSMCLVRQVCTGYAENVPGTPGMRRVRVRRVCAGYAGVSAGYVPCMRGICRECASYSVLHACSRRTPEWRFSLKEVRTRPNLCSREATRQTSVSAEV